MSRMVQVKIRGEVLKFPKDWNKDKIVQWVNTDIRVCPICNKVDVEYDHFNSCDPVMEKQKCLNKYYKY